MELKDLYVAPRCEVARNLFGLFGAGVLGSPRVATGPGVFAGSVAETDLSAIAAAHDKDSEKSAERCY
jgi:hypothetical protein